LHTLSSLLELAAVEAKGPRPSFSRAHLLLAFLTIGGRGMIGRQALAREAGLGEGAVRTVLGKLREEGLTEVDASGAHLTKRGTELLSTIFARLTPIVMLSVSPIAMGKTQAAVGVRRAARRVGSGIQQRDSAIMEGAAGATTIIVRGSKFGMPGGSGDCEAEFPSPAWRLLRNQIAPRTGDAVILCGAEDEIRAKLGVIAAALTLL